jgi:iron complex outermembrane receptor protein
MFITSSNRHVQSRTAFIVLVLLLAIFKLPIAVSAETLTGQVLDPQNKTIAGAQVRLFDRTSGEMRTTKSADDGTYSFKALPMGSFLLEGGNSSGTLSGSSEVTIAGDQKMDLKLEISGLKSEVLVVATSAPQQTNEISKAVDSIDSEEIELRDENSVPDAIRSLPGIRVQTQEGPGSLTTIKMRGLGAQDTAVVVDGIAFRDASSIQGDATSMFEDMSLIDADRIEVLRGSGSSVYGSHALGGVINITSNSGGGPMHGQFLAEGGGLGTIRSLASISGGLSKDEFTYSVGLSHINVTKGPRDGLPFRNTGTQISTGYRINKKMSLTGKLWYANSYLATTESPTVNDDILANSAPTGEVKAIPLPIDQLELFEKGQPFNAGNATYIPNQIDPDSRRIGKFYTGVIGFQHQLTNSTTYQLEYHGVSTSRTYLDGPAGPGSFEPAASVQTSFNGYTNSGLAHIEQKAGRHNRLSGGYDYERERFVSLNGTYSAPSSTGSTRFKQRSSSFFAQDLISLADSRLQITVGGRAQVFNLKIPQFSGYTSPYGDVTLIAPPTAYTADGAIAYYIRSSGTKLRAHAGNSYRAPSGYERFGGDSGFFYGDPTLAPERARSIDAGFDQKFFGSRVTLSATAFYTKLQESITFSNNLGGPAPTQPPDPNDPNAPPEPVGPFDPYGRTSGYQNGSGGISRGLEASAHLSPTSKTNIGLSYTYLNSDSNAPTIGTDYYKVLGVSPNMFTATAAQWFGTRVSASVDMSAYSKYTNTISGAGDRQFVFDAPIKADAAMHYNRPLSERRSADFYVKVENLLNKRFYEDGFIGPKIWAVGGVRYKF